MMVGVLIGMIILLFIDAILIWLALMMIKEGDYWESGILLIPIAALLLFIISILIPDLSTIVIEWLRSEV